MQNQVSNLFIDNNLDLSKIGIDVLNAIFSFKHNNIIIDYKIYEALKKLSICQTENLKLQTAIAFKTDLPQASAKFYFSLLDSDYICVDRVIHFALNSDCYENNKSNDIIAIKMKT